MNRPRPPCTIVTTCSENIFRHWQCIDTADESAATATLMLPGSLGPGVYPLYLTAAGSKVISGGTLFVGQQVWLPLIAR